MLFFETLLREIGNNVSNQNISVRKQRLLYQMFCSRLENKKGRIGDSVPSSILPQRRLFMLFAPLPYELHNQLH